MVMNKLVWILGFAAVLSTCAVGQEAGTPTTKTAANYRAVSIAHSPRILRGQPVSLFDGRSLDGWVRRNGEPAKNWTVSDGAIYRSGGGGDLYHQHWFRDFELSFEWKIEAGGNSGVKYRVQPYGKQMLGCEYQIQDDKDKPFNRHATGAIYAVVEPSKNKTQNATGEWNTSKIVVCGDRVEHWLNGQRVVNARIGSLDWLKRVEGSKFRDKAFFGQNREGRVFLQDHGNPVWYRNIVLVPLDADAPNCICVQ